MTRLSSVFGAAALALAIGATGVLAQTTAPAAGTAATKAPAATTMAKKAPVPKVATTEAGKKCSADADAKGLHGKDRRKFRNKCVKDYKAGKM